jgi:hypothetical protein
MCPIPNGFRDKDISLYSSKLLIRKRYYVLFRENVKKAVVAYFKDNISILSRTN